MNLSAKPPFPRLIPILLIVVALLSCNFLTNLASNPSPSTSSNQTGGETPGVAEQPSPAGEEPTAQNSDGTPAVTEQPPSANENATAAPDPLDHLLGLRSIIIQLTAQRPDGSGSSTQVEIDSAGNMHVKYSLPTLDAKLFPQGSDTSNSSELFVQGFDTSKLPTSSELFVMDGKAYQPSDQDPAWMSAPMDANYLQTLSDEFYGPDGFGEWLDILPDGSLISAGQESVGGFQTDTYTVNGTVDGQAVTGKLWYEPQSDSLVKAELNVPAALYDPTDKSLTGALKVSLDTQKANVPLVTLPSAPAGTAEPSATP